MASAKDGESGLSRNPPEAVKYALRKEVGFGCPLPYCRVPFLTWHHFDPPWSVEEHHRPEGMIALCTEHHAMADRNVFSKSRLRDMKNSDWSVQTVLARFEWARPRHLVQIGGYYTTGIGTWVLRQIGHFSAFAFSESVEGLQELTFSLRDEYGHVLVDMVNNAFTAEPHKLHDVAVDPGGTKLKVRVKKTDAILDLWCRRIKSDELEEMLQDDWEHWEKFKTARKKTDPIFRTWQEVCVNPHDPNPDIRIIGGQPNPFLPPTLPSEGESTEYRDWVIHGVLDHASRKLKDEEDYISVIDCRKLLTYLPEGICKVENGFVSAGMGIGFGCYMAGHHLIPPTPDQIANQEKS